MKVVLFCGGLGMRIREFSESIPKPMINIGYRPILWHVMKYYAHYGHKDFVLCLGYRGDSIKDYFLHYNECLSNDFTLSHGEGKLELLNTDIQDWNITFVDTGITSNIGERLRKVEPHLRGESMFLANYSDGLTDLHLPDFVRHGIESDKVASFLCVKPSHSFHVVSMGESGLVNEVKHVGEADIWMNGGYFLLKNEIFDYMREGEELVLEPFARLIKESQLAAYKYEGFWASMDTLKDKQQLEELHSWGKSPWEVWSERSQTRTERMELRGLANSAGSGEVQKAVPMVRRVGL